MSDERTLAAMTARQFQRKADHLAYRLRAIADEVEREASRAPNRVSAPEYGWKASQMVHAVTWGMANADLSGLVAAASEADAATE